MKMNNTLRRLILALILFAGVWAYNNLGIRELFESPGTEISEDWRNKPLIYTKHAKCRMGCRYIDAEEIADILKNGKINSRKSKPGDSPCPTVALEGITRDRQEVRIVFAQCDHQNKVVTAIDLGEDHVCHCD